MALFRDRSDAGRRLAGRLLGLKQENPIVFGLARGGVPVGFEIARALGCPLEVLVVRKVASPEQPELALGAVTEGGVSWLDPSIAEALGVGPVELRRLLAEQEAEIPRRVERYRDGRAPADVRGRTVILVDDGLATGATALAAVALMRARGARRVVMAAPVASPRVERRFGPDAEVVTLATPADFSCVGEWYDDFAAVPDDLVEQLVLYRRGAAA